MKRLALSSEAAERQLVFGDLFEAHLRPGSLPPPVPAPPSLTLTIPACQAYVRGADGILVYVEQGAHTVGPLNAGNGEYWLALHRDSATVVAGWTREPGTRWLWQLAATKPADPASALVTTQVTVAAGAITRVMSLGRYALREQVVLYARQFTRLYGMTGEALQAAIDALPPSGGIVKIDAGMYTLTVPLTLGNGGVGVGSTRHGIVLEGIGVGNYNEAQHPVVLQWAGGADPVVYVQGPLVGWGLKNLYIDGGGTASAGVFVQSGQYGEVVDITVAGHKGNGIWSTAVPSAPPLVGWTGVTDALKNSWHNVWIWHLPPADPGTAALVLDTTDISANTDFNQFYNLTIFTAGVDGWAIYLGGADHNMFYNTHIGDDPTTRSDVHYAYDNAGFNGWPCGNNFYGLSLNNEGMTSSGTPLADNTCVNYIFGMSGGDPADFIPDLPGVVSFIGRRVNQNLVLGPGSNPASAQPVGNVEILADAAHPRAIIPSSDGWLNLGTLANRFHDAYLLGGVRSTTRGETTSTVLTLADYYLQIGSDVAPLVVTLPPVVDAAGREYVIKNYGTQTLTLTPVGGTLINALGTYVLTAVPETVRILSTGVTWEVIAAFP